jgi:Zn-finger nucleic acid-binding protein
MPSPLCPGCRSGLRSDADPGGLFCASCGGLWLDPEALAARGASLPKRYLGTSGGERLCPRGHGTLFVKDSAMVTIDVCGTCHGVYLDPGELTLLLRAGGASLAGGDHEGEFLCDLCKAWRPRGTQVVGEQLTVCPACAARQGISHDPRARRKFLQQREKMMEADESLGFGIRGSNSFGVRSVGSGSGGGSLLALVLELLSWFA